MSGRSRASSRAGCSELFKGVFDEAGADDGLTHLLSRIVEGFEVQAPEGLDFGWHGSNFILVDIRYRSEIDDVLLPLSRHDVPYRLRERRWVAST